MNIIKITTVNFTLLKKHYCHKCGSKLEVRESIEDIYPGDERFIGTLKGIEFNEKITHYFECPNCGAIYSAKKQKFVSRVQKVKSRSIVENNELIEYYKSNENISYLKRNKKINLVLFLFSLLISLIFALLSIFFYSKRSYIQGLLFFVLTGITAMLCQWNIVRVKKLMQEVNYIINPISEEEWEYKRLKKLVKKHIIAVLIYSLIFIGFVIYGIFIIKKESNLPAILILIISAIMLLTFLINQIVRLVSVLDDFLDYKSYFKK